MALEVKLNIEYMNFSGTYFCWFWLSFSRHGWRHWEHILLPDFCILYHRFYRFHDVCRFGWINAWPINIMTYICVECVMMPLFGSTNKNKNYVYQINDIPILYTSCMLCACAFNGNQSTPLYWCTIWCDVNALCWDSFIFSAMKCAPILFMKSKCVNSYSLKRPNTLKRKKENWTNDDKLQIILMFFFPFSVPVYCVGYNIPIYPGRM